MPLNSGVGRRRNEEQYQMMALKSNDIVRLDSSFGKHAVETLVRAFRNQLPFQYYYQDKAARERITYYLISMAVLPALKYGEVHASSSNLEGIAVWVPSDNYPIATWKLLRSVPLSVTLGFAIHGGYRMKSLGEYIDAVHARLAPFKHMYLQSLGVDPQYQGKGHAGKLLRYMINRMDSEGLPCYLETAEEHNVQLYEHFGFTVADESTIPGTSLTNWAMLRKTRQSE
jgi:ribosomal protein S18 acetylase RimI-like enzyme